MSTPRPSTTSILPRLLLAAAGLLLLAQPALAERRVLLTNCTGSDGVCVVEWDKRERVQAPATTRAADGPIVLNNHDLSASPDEIAWKLGRTTGSARTADGFFLEADSPVGTEVWVSEVEPIPAPQRQAPAPRPQPADMATCMEHSIRAGLPYQKSQTTCQAVLEYLEAIGLHACGDTTL